LLAVVGIQPYIHVVDVTATGLIGQQRQQLLCGGTAPPVSLLPKGLSQREVRVAAEDKDAYCYYYLLKVPRLTLCTHHPPTTCD